ncbi:J domain-containing protein [Patescibacteria group bacterium]|nr:MAG: J domain-containing protein [Patescibacteria group bacterium]
MSEHQQHQDDVDLGWFFRNMPNMFGHKSKKKMPVAKPTAIAKSITLELKDLILGKKVEIDIDCDAACLQCLGVGKVFVATEPCSSCGGTGMFTRNEPGIQMRMTCAQCQGSGKGQNPCEPCSGNGTRKVKQPLKINIPPGFPLGSQLRQQIDPGLVLLVNVDTVLPPDTEIYEEGRVVRTIRLTYPQLILGTTITTPLLEGGTTNIKIPPRIDLGQLIRLKGKGLVKSPMGSIKDRTDLFLLIELMSVDLTTTTPTLNNEFIDKETVLLEQLDALYNSVITQPSST